MKHILIIICLALFSVFIHGYKFAFSDQEIFIPYLLKESNPSLFPGDELFNQLSAKTSLFYPLYGFLSNFADLETLFFFSFMIFQILFFLAIFRLSYVLTKDKKLAYLSLTLFFLPKFIGGTATSTFDDFFGYRSIGVIFLIFYLSNLIEGKMTKSALFALGGIIFHPLSIIPNIVTLPSIWIAKKIASRKRTILVLSLVVGFISTILLLIFQKDDLWFSIIKSRDSYILPSTWQTRGWLSFALYFSLLFVLLPKLERKIRKTILILVFICLIVFLANFAILDILKTPQIAKFQLARSITPVAYIALAASPLFIVSKSFTLKLIGGVCLVTLALNKFELFVPAFAAYSLLHFLKDRPFKIESKVSGTFTALVITLSLLSVLVAGGDLKSQFANIQFPKMKNDWINLQLWAKNYTSIDSTFLVPPRQTGFRIFSERPIVGDIKDGAVVIYDSNHAYYWSSLMKDLDYYNNFDELKFINLKEKYHYSYLVTFKIHELHFPVVYQNNSYTVYKI